MMRPFQHGSPNSAEHMFPDRLTLAATRVLSLRYGENPHQSAAVYRNIRAPAGLLAAVQVQGKELSYTTSMMPMRHLRLSANFPSRMVLLRHCQHANPCGIAVATTARGAYGQALACDPVSAFGGIIAFNRRLDRDTASAIAEIFTEVIFARVLMTRPVPSLPARRTCACCCCQTCLIPRLTVWWSRALPATSGTGT